MQILAVVRVENYVNNLNEHVQNEALPEEVTAAPHLQSLLECIERKPCTAEILTTDFGKKQSMLILRTAVLKLH